MSDEQATVSNRADNQAVVLSTGLAIASLILLPAVAARIGLGASLTGALRIALMKASNRVSSRKPA
ncbi:MAG: hypothetical protein RQ867_04910 [Mariprofundaceae bacterium]|nr:hypothetical protein [Mariprofundaceae bacterium]